MLLKAGLNKATAAREQDQPTDDPRVTDAFDQDQITSALKSAWSAKTSGGWLAHNPARGQCNVTALVVNELFGGSILKTRLPEADHFYNWIDGQRFDFTASQFAAPIAYADMLSSRDEALAGTTEERYTALKIAFGRAFETTR